MTPFTTIVQHQIDWSSRTFGTEQRTEGLCQHITKELDEIRQSPLDLTEWIDVIILAIDGAWRAGYSAQEISSALEAKMAKNCAREWPTNVPEDKPIEHLRPMPRSESCCPMCGVELDKHGRCARCGYCELC